MPEASRRSPSRGRSSTSIARATGRPLRLRVPDRLGNVPFRQLATLEIEPGELLIKNGFPLPRSGSTMVTQDDFLHVIAAIERAADAELGSGAGSPAARPGEKSRYYE